MKRKIINKVNYLRKKLLLKTIHYKNFSTGTIEKAKIKYIGAIDTAPITIAAELTDGSNIEVRHIIFKENMNAAQKEMANLRIFRNRQKLDGQLEYTRDILNKIHEDEKLLAKL